MKLYQVTGSGEETLDFFCATIDDARSQARDLAKDGEEAVVYAAETEAITRPLVIDMLNRNFRVQEKDRIEIEKWQPAKGGKIQVQRTETIDAEEE